MKVVFFGIATEKNAAIRYRVMKFADMLAQEGHTCIVCLPSSVERYERLWERGNRFTKGIWCLSVLGRRILQLRHVIGADAILFRGALAPAGFGPPILERLIRLINPRMIYDIDDAVWEREAYVTSPFYGLTDFNWTWKMCRMCAHGIVGNAYLKQHVEKINPNVTIVPTCIDVALHTPKTYPDPDPNRPIVLGWTGTAGNIGFMSVIEDALRELAKKYTIVLSFSSSIQYRLDGVNVVWRPWEATHEFDYLREADIGLMPLTDTPFSRGKCAFKALQYMGVGTPCVISPVGMNAEVIEDGVDGFLANTPDEWYDKLERLIVDPELRRRTGEAGRMKVIKKYSAEANYPNFRHVIGTVAALKGK